MDIITHITTPFYMNAVDFDVLGFSVDRQARYNVDGVHLCGWWGEKSTLSDSEHIACVKEAIKSANGKIKVYASAGSNDTAKSEKLAHALLDLGVDGITLTLPYYNKGSEKEIVRSVKKIKSITSDKRTFLFYEKDRALGIDAENEIIKSGIEVVRADGEWAKTAYDGDSFLLNALAVDSTLFSFVACIFPSAITHVRECWKSGKTQKATDMYFDLADKIKVLQKGGVPYLKYALSLWGLSYPSVRSPYFECDDDEKTLIRRFFD